MENRHVGIDYEEAVLSKKNLLLSEIGLLHTIKKMSAYRSLRKREIASKTRLKSAISELKSKINLLQSTFPEDIRKPEKAQKIEKLEKKSKEETNKEMTIEKELEDIRAKLSRLG